VWLFYFRDRAVRTLPRSRKDTFFEETAKRYTNSGNDTNTKETNGC